MVRAGKALLAAALASTIGAYATDVSAETPGTIAIELNKLEAREGGTCRAYVVFENRSGEAYEALRLDLIFFGVDGVIAKRLAVDAAPLKPRKTAVKLFDVADLDCAKIGQVLLNDILACREKADAEAQGCADRLAVSSRVPAVAFVK